MMSKTAVASIAAAGLLLTSGLSPASAQGRTLKDRFVGTWKLVSIETRNAKGEVIPPAAGANQNRIGYIVFDDAGYMAVTIMPLGRKKAAGAQMTDEEAQAALAGYAGYFGTFTINEKEPSVTYHVEGSIDPALPRDQKRFFEMSGNRLTLKPPPGPSGSQQRFTWERMPDLSNPTAEQKKFVGFWKLISNERRNDKGEVLGTNPGQAGYIIYTAAGFMTVHMVQPDRKPYAAAQATPAEARQNLRTYTNYFGPFYVHEVDGYVVHDQFGSLGVGRGGYSPQQRFYRFVGNRLLLQPPPTYNADGTVTQGTITWEKVGKTAGTP
jgi:hypothetical protein